MARGYVPERGDLVWLEFDPQAGHEQAGTRPAMVLSPSSYNGRTGLALACPITNQIKGYPFEVVLPAAGIKVTGAVLADQIRCVDWQARKARRIAAAPGSVIAEVLAKSAALLH